jgi:hypothetical protein
MRKKKRREANIFSSIRTRREEKEKKYIFVSSMVVPVSS